MPDQNKEKEGPVLSSFERCFERSETEREREREGRGREKEKGRLGVKR